MNMHASTDSTPAGADNRDGRRRMIAAALSLGVAGSLAVLLCAPVLQYAVVMCASAHVATAAGGPAQPASRSTAGLRRKLEACVPAQPYLIVSSTDNTFVLKKGDTVIRQGLCSTGSFVLLETRDRSRAWMFSTPRGVYRVQQKKQNPVWKRPDWAFVEEGRPVPAPDASERYERGVLGDYALILGHGYMVHGTLYQRFLGRPVTHGCVRLGDDDLEAVYRNLEIGGKVFLY